MEIFHYELNTLLKYLFYPLSFKNSSTICAQRQKKSNPVPYPVISYPVNALIIYLYAYIRLRTYINGCWNFFPTHKRIYIGKYFLMHVGTSTYNTCHANTFTLQRKKNSTLLEANTTEEFWLKIPISRKWFSTKKKKHASSKKEKEKGHSYLVRTHTYYDPEYNTGKDSLRRQFNIDIVQGELYVGWKLDHYYSKVVWTYEMSPLYTGSEVTWWPRWTIEIFAK